MNRQTLAAITHTQAEALLLVLKQLWQQPHISEAAKMTAFSQAFQLLARWTHAFHLSTATSEADRRQLQEATATALQLLHSSWYTAQACAACILFLGGASQGKHLHCTLHLQSAVFVKHNCTPCCDHSPLA